MALNEGIEAMWPLPRARLWWPKRPVKTAWEHFNADGIENI
jgi:hypothetical protein